MDVIRHFTLGDIYAVLSRTSYDHRTVDRIMDGFVLNSRPPRPFNKYDPGFQDGVPKTMESDAYTVGTTADETMTPLFTLDQVVVAMKHWGVTRAGQEAVLDNLQAFGPHATLMGWGLAENLGVVNRKVEPGTLEMPEVVTVPDEDILTIGDVIHACMDVAMDTESIDEIIENAKNHKVLRLHTKRLKIEEIPFHYKGLRMRFPAAEKPEWMTFTDYKTFYNENGIKKAILVLDGEAYICDGDVNVDFDMRRKKKDD